MRWINAEKVIHTQIYDDEYEEWSEREMTIEEFLDAFTDEGCPTVVTQPEPQWIPCSKPPEESETYIVTAYDGTGKRVTFVKYQKTLKRWDLTGARSYWRILAYKPLPEPWRGEEK